MSRTAKPRCTGVVAYNVSYSKDGERRVEPVRCRKRAIVRGGRCRECSKTQTIEVR